MNNLKKIGLLFILASGLISMSIVATAANENTLNIWAWNINGPVIKAAATAYQKTHPGFSVNVVDLSTDDVYTKLSVGLQAKGAGLADVILVEDTHLAGFLENWPSGFTNLSKLGYDQYASNFPAFKRNVVQVNGQFYAMPFDIGPVGVFYRPSFFKKAGIDPKSIQTWDDYIAAGKVIFAKTGAYMTNVRSDEDIIVRVLVNQNGVHYYDDKGQIDFNNPKLIEAFDLIKRMNDAGILYKGAKGWDGFVQAFVSSKIVAIPNGAWLAGTIDSQAKDQAGDWGVMPLPKNTEGKNASNIGGSNFVIPSSSKHVQLAYDFMTFFTTQLEPQEVAFRGGLFPSFAPVYKTEAFNQPYSFFGNQSIWTDLAKVVPDVPKATYTMDYATAREEIIKALTDTVFKDVPAKTALSDAAKRLANRTGRTINKY